MKNIRRFVHILIGVFTLLIGVLSTESINKSYVEIIELDSLQIQSDILSKPYCPRFRNVNGESFGSYEIFRVSDDAPRFANDYISCVEIADKIHIYHNTELKPELTHYTLKAQCGKANKNLVERGLKLDENGQKIGERCLTIFPQGRSHIFWTEGEEFWFISTTSLELAKEFESSEAFHLWKSGNYSNQE